MPAPCLQRQRSRPECETFGFRNSRTTASKPSNEIRSVLCSAAAKASCTGVSVVWRRCGVWLRFPTVSPLMPLPHDLPRVSLALRNNLCRFSVRLDRRSDLRRHSRLAVQFDQHVALPSETSLITDRAMISAERRRAMRSSGMEQRGAGQGIGICDRLSPSHHAQLFRRTVAFT